MKRVWQRSATLVAGLLVTAMYAMPQAYTISARPGAINYIEGHAFLNGKPLSDKGLRASFLTANDTLSTDIGKAEILLTPGVFLRIGENSQVRLVSPSLTDTQLEVVRGEAMIEADGLLKDNHIAVVDHGASITIEKNGLYRFTADSDPTAAVLDGKAQVYVGDKKVELGKGRETLLTDNLKEQKFNTKQQDDLYAWSNLRSEYDAATSYQTAKNATVNNSNSAGWGGYGFTGGYNPGWYWNSALNGYGWIPGDGAFFSPFGYGFYGAAYLPYAPVMVTSGGGYYNGRWVGSGTRTTVPVNPNNPPAVGVVTNSVAANNVARARTAQSFASTGGLRTAGGRPAGSFSGGRAGGFSGVNSAAHSSGAAAMGGGGHAGGVGVSGAHR